MASTRFSSMSVKEVRELLVSKYNYTEAEAQALKKTEAVDKLLALQNDNEDDVPAVDDFVETKEDINLEVFGADDTAEFEPNSPENTPKQGKIPVSDTLKVKDVPQKVVEKDVPIPTDPEWHDYVMSKFLPEELMNENPTADGLRRVVQLLVGEIVCEHVHVYAGPEKQNNYQAATVSVEVHLKTPTGCNRTMSGSASVSTMNTERPYVNHPVSTAETKAEGRAFRKLLNLRKVLAAEEVSEVANEIHDPNEFDPGAMITDQQKMVINLLAKNSKVNLKKFLKSGKSASYESLDDVPFGVAATMMEILNDMANGAKVVPDHIKDNGDS